MSTTTPPLNKQLGDYLLAITPLVTALAGFQWGGLIPGANGFLVGVFVGAFAKFLAGFAQYPHLSNWEDLIPLIVVFLAFLSTSFSADPRFLQWGIVIGFVVKALAGFKKGGNLTEDGFLFVGAFMAAYGAYIGNQQLAAAGLLLSTIGKTFPSIATAGQPASPPNPAPTPP